MLPKEITELKNAIRATHGCDSLSQWRSKQDNRHARVAAREVSTQRPKYSYSK